MIFSFVCRSVCGRGAGPKLGSGLMVAAVAEEAYRVHEKMVKAS